MPTFLEVKCPCGRMLRARIDQAGTMIQCWDCKAEVVVPFPAEPWLADPMADVAFQALRSRGMGAIAGGVPLITALLLVPRAGLLLALGLVALSVHWYGRQMRPRELIAASVGRRALLLRGAMAVLATLALVAPQLARNQGHVLPPANTLPESVWLAALALAAWLVTPVAILAVYAHDAHGPLPPRTALGALLRHWPAALAALAVFPAALIVTEGVLALFAWEQGQLPLLVVDLFPPPRSGYLVDGKHLYFNYDGTRLDKNYSESVEALAAAYPLAFRHGYMLVGTIPPSLPMGLLEVRTNPWEYEVTPESYLLHRIAFTFLVLAVSGIALMVQARWLGLIASIGARRSSPPAG
jgi:hypothetical protein